MRHIHRKSSRFAAIFSISLLGTLTMIFSQATAQQDVRKVYTDFGGFWTSSADTISTTKPDNSHMLLGFSYKNTVYSTGVSDKTLRNRGIAFSASTFQSFQLANNAIPVSIATKIGVGTNYGGNGNVTPIPVKNDLTEYLVDGQQGLDLGTAIFNIPGSQMRYKVSKIFSNRISDGIPDVLVTQVGAPPASTVRDTFRFEDSLGNVIGNPVSISMSNISIVGTGNWKFYTPGTPCSYDAGLQGDRPLRMMAFELSDFGLTAANIALVSRFVHRVSGESDQAFVAYNSTAFTAAIGTVLPITLESFDVRKNVETAQLSWKVSETRNFSHFEVERATWGGFESIGSIQPEQGTTTATYAFTDTKPAKGSNRYRLRMIDLDGSSSYSPVQSLLFDSRSISSTVYPNPAAEAIYVQSTDSKAMISLVNISGAVVAAPVTSEGSRQRIDVSAVPAGMYLVRVLDAAGLTTTRIMVSH